ncbi:MAG: SDR family NAD(P)-dependent oxidoreductase, partial [Myxococcales bacterium]|nr:SDR family NAD(P)-dependent oxidoreductase [Myxococcales bacterium]
MAARTPEEWRARYGPWALVTGAAQGIGAAFAEALAARGLDLVLADVQEAPLVRLAAELERRFDARTRVAVVDLAERDFHRVLRRRIDDISIGLLVCNAGVSHRGEFFNISLEAHRRALDVNCAS